VFATNAGYGGVSLLNGFVTVRHVSVSTIQELGLAAEDLVFQMHIPILKRTVLFGVDWERFRGEGANSNATCDYVYAEVMAISDNELRTETDETPDEELAPTHAGTYIGLTLLYSSFRTCDYGCCVCRSCMYALTFSTHTFLCCNIFRRGYHGVGAPGEGICSRVCHIARRYSSKSDVLQTGGSCACVYDMQLMCTTASAYFISLQCTFDESC
jgi:hypothetical protein